MFASLGKEMPDETLEAMLSEAPGNLNFTSFLTLFGERLAGSDSQQVLLDAFKCLNEDDSGLISEDRLRELLTTMGQRFSHDQVFLALLPSLKVDDLLRDAPLRNGLLDYVELTRLMKNGRKDDVRRANGDH